MSFKSYLIKNLLLLIITLITAVISLLIGSVEISFSDLFNVLTGTAQDNFKSQIITEIRFPRVLLAVAVGGGLSAAGAVFQAILMNPLAEPYILGISSGGAFGAVLSILIGVSFIFTQLFAFAGAVFVVFIVFLLGKRFGELEPNVLLLSGVMVGAFFAAAILIMMTLMNESLRAAVLWLIGNLAMAKRESVFYVLPVTVIISILLTMNAHKYNLISLGTESAGHLGVNTRFIKNATYAAASIMIGSIVAVSGIIGFVGLLVPHACRLIFGIDNRIIIPASFFTGASFLIIADTAARTIISPAELPVGAITAFLGAPLFIYLLRRRFAFNSG